MDNKNMNILVTGSAGFIGAPLAYDLLKMGHRVIGIDSYINSNPEKTLKLEINFKNKFKFFKLDLSSNIEILDSVLNEHKPDLVIHLAALKSVQESIINPDLYLINNIESTRNIIKIMKLHGCKKIIYSSSAAVYGNQDTQPIMENAVCRPISPYAESKLACEELIKDTANQGQIDGISLRYFNPIGSHSSNLFKEQLVKKTGTIMQEIVKVALKKNKFLKIYGNSYSTKDGTCERDFIHIDDLLGAHLKSIDFINSFEGYDVYNVGTGNPITILNLIESFIKYNKLLINYEFINVRPGDIASNYADTTKINKEMRWKSKKGLKEMVVDSWIPYSLEEQ